MRLTCDLQEALPVCAPEKDSCLPPVDLFPIFYHFLTHLKYQKHQTDKYEILEEATHGHTLKKKNNNNKKNGWNMKIIFPAEWGGRKHWYQAQLLGRRASAEYQDSVYSLTS